MKQDEKSFRKLLILPKRKKESELSPDGFEQFELVPPKKPFKLRLKELRKEFGLNQTQAGAIVFTSQKQYSRWETGQYDISLYELCYFAIYYNRSIDYILGLSDDNSPLFTEEERQNIIDNLEISRYFNKQGLWPAPSGVEVMKKWVAKGGFNMPY